MGHTCSLTSTFYFQISSIVMSSLWDCGHGKSLEKNSEIDTIGKTDRNCEKLLQRQRISGSAFWLGVRFLFNEETSESKRVGRLDPAWLSEKKSMTDSIDFKIENCWPWKKEKVVTNVCKRFKLTGGQPAIPYGSAKTPKIYWSLRPILPLP